MNTATIFGSLFSNWPSLLYFLIPEGVWVEEQRQQHAGVYAVTHSCAHVNPWRPHFNAKAKSSTTPAAYQTQRRCIQKRLLWLSRTFTLSKTLQIHIWTLQKREREPFHSPHVFLRVFKWTVPFSPRSSLMSNVLHLSEMRGEVKTAATFVKSGRQRAVSPYFYKSCSNLKRWRVPIYSSLQKRASEIYN